MSTISHRGNAVQTAGHLPATGTKAPEFRLTGTSLKDVHLADFAGKRVIMNIFPSIDTSTCATSVRRFNTLATQLDNTVVLCISKDLPFAHKRFCGAEGIENVIPLAQYKDTSFSDAYGVDLLEGGLAGLMSRAIVVVDSDGTILHTEQVQDIGQEPNYEAALSALS